MDLTEALVTVAAAAIGGGGLGVTGKHFWDRRNGNSAFVRKETCELVQKWQKERHEEVMDKLTAIEAKLK